MSSWLSERVGGLVPLVQHRHAAGAGAGGQRRTADELAAELEQQARRVSEPHGAAALLRRWLERCDSQEAFPLAEAARGPGGAAGGAAGAGLSFQQALLRSRALEALLEACGRAAALRAELLRPGAGVEAGGGLRQALRAAAERLLLPGALALWPGLLEVLLTTVREATGDKRSKVSEPGAGQWARRALALVKRHWQSEVLTTEVQGLDRKLLKLMAKSSAQASDGQLSFSVAGDRMSKNGIRAALACDKLKTCTSEAERLRDRTELLCDAVERLEVSEKSSFSILPESEQLLVDADRMLESLDASVKAELGEQKAWKASLSDLTENMQEQMARFQDMITSFEDKRGPIEQERSTLRRRLEELELQIAQINEGVLACKQKSQTLAGQLRSATNDYESKIAKSYQWQKHLADEKLQAAACKETANTARDVVQNEEARRAAELASELRRRRADLRRSCAAYLRAERLRLEASVAALAARAAPGPAGAAAPAAPSPAAAARPPGRTPAAAAGADAASVPAAAEESWGRSQAVLQRVRPLLECGAELGANAGGVIEPRASEEPVAMEVVDRSPPPEDAAAFFASVRGTVASEST